MGGNHVWVVVRLRPAFSRYVRAMITTLPISEAGCATPKFFRRRAQLFAKYLLRVQLARIRPGPPAKARFVTLQPR